MWNNNTIYRLLYMSPLYYLSPSTSHEMTHAKSSYTPEPSEHEYDNSDLG